MRVLVDGSHHPKVEHALRRLAAVEPIERVTHGAADMVVGTVAGSPTVRALLEEWALAVPDAPESLSVTHHGPTLVVAGRDDQGLMYALLEVADQLALEGRDLAAVREVVEQPETSHRGIFTFLHNADCEREWFRSEAHWEAHFDLLARSRFNSFQLVMAHQTNYLAPPFPFFVDVPDHPDVKVPELSNDERHANLDALRMIARIAHERGLQFVLGIWELIAWLPTSRGGHSQRSMVAGLNQENVASYTYDATRRLLDEVPGIDGLQLRVNGESGIPEEGQAEFFTNTIFRAMRDTGRDVFLDLRGWIASPATIDAAHAMGLPMRLSMKYWAEHLGPPYQAAMQWPAYSYADFLRHPRRHPISYQVWALGSHRHFVWGDPDYVRTFARSLRFGNSAGFEISPPLAQKGFGNEPGAWRVLTPEHDHVRWEWERYWLFYLLFGRLTYDPDTPTAVWRRELDARFGALASVVLDAFEAASRIVSFVILVNMSDPNMYIWPEADTGGLLDYYTSVPPSDRALVKSFREAAAEQLSGRFTARLSPAQAAAHLDDVGRRCVDAVAVLRAATVDVPAKAELSTTVCDVEALGALAQFHACKVRAAEQIARYEATGDLAALLEAQQHLLAAGPHWQRLVAVTEDVYTSRQVTGPVDSGHWRDKLVLVAEDEERLAERIQLHRRYGGGTLGGAVVALDLGARRVEDYSYSRSPVFQDTVERGFLGVEGGDRWEHPSTRAVGWTGATVATVAATLGRLHDRHTDTVFRDTMTRPGYEHAVALGNLLYRDYVTGTAAAELRVVVPAGHHEVIVILCDRTEQATDHGPFSVVVCGEVVAADLVVPAGELVELRVRCELGQLLVVGFEPGDGADWFCSGLVVRPDLPIIRHTPIWTARADRDLVVTATVDAPDGIASVYLRATIGDVSTATPMTSGDGLVFEATISADELTPCRGVRYSIEADDQSGRTARLPVPGDDLTAFTVVVTDASARPPMIAHRPVSRAIAGSGVDVVVDVVADRPVRRATLHYRWTSQHVEWQQAAMSGYAGSYVAEIPGDYVVTEWDLMYFVEVVDDAGLGSLAPGAPGLDAIPYWVITVDR